MKALSRNLKRSEKALLIVLAVILIGLLYYKFVYVNIEETISTANAEAENLQSDVDIATAQLMGLQKMQDELDAVKADPDLSRVESYNNSTSEIAFLNDILENALQYSVSFGDVTRSGDLVRRNFTLQYQTRGYAAAQSIMEALGKSPYRCRIGDLACSIGGDNLVTISTTATFYETMVGGTADSGLPADQAATAESE